jgi:hypothetical protein
VLVQTGHAGKDGKFPGPPDFTAGNLLAATPVARLVEESSLILGWVANWRQLIDGQRGQRLPFDVFGNQTLASNGTIHEQMIEVVSATITDGQVCDWLRQNVKRTPAEKRAHAEGMLHRPPQDDPAALDGWRFR